MYALLHSPAYHKRFAEFLRGDFPRLRLTTVHCLFSALGRKGGEMVALHLMESPRLEELMTTLAEKGNNAGWRVT